VLLNIANAVWAQDGMSFEPGIIPSSVIKVFHDQWTTLTSFRLDFLQTLEQEFHSPLEKTDFAHNAKKAVEEINSWVSKQTNKKIDRVCSFCLLSSTESEI